MHNVKPDIRPKSRFLPTPPAFNAVPIGLLPNRLVCKKTRMVYLPDSEKILKLCLLVSTEYTNVTGGRTDTGRHSIVGSHQVRPIKRSNCLVLP